MICDGDTATECAPPVLRGIIRAEQDRAARAAEPFTREQVAWIDRRIAAALADHGSTHTRQHR